MSQAAPHSRAWRIATPLGYAVDPDMGINDAYGRRHRLEVVRDRVDFVGLDRRGSELCRSTLVHGDSLAELGDGGFAEVFLVGGPTDANGFHPRVRLRSKLAEMIDPLVIDVEAHHPDIGQDLPPMPGHAVRLKSGGRSWFSPMCDGKVGVLSGSGMQIGSVTFNAIAHQVAQNRSVSCSGGPATIGSINPAHLRRIGTERVTFWRFRNLEVTAHNSATTSVLMPLWEWDADAYEAELSAD